MNLATASAAAGAADAAVNGLHSLYNFGKDLFNVDNERSERLNKELMLYQFGLNQQSADYNLSRARSFLASQAATQEKLMETQLGMNKELMGKSQQYNIENAQRQFLYNMYLSSKARDIYNQRAMGINPSAGAGSPAVGSTGLPSAPQGSVNVSSPSGSLGAASTVASGVPSASHYASPSGSARAFVATLNDIEDYKFKLEQNKYKAVRALLEVQDAKASIRAKSASSGLSEAETRKTLELLDRQEQEIVARIKNLDASTRSTEKKTDYIDKEFELDKWYKENQLLVDKMNAQTNRAFVSIEREKLPAVVDELKARASKQWSDSSLTQQDILWYAERVEKMLELTEANIDNIEQQAKLNMNKAKLAGKDLDWYEEKIIYEQVMGVVDSVLSALPWNSRSRIVTAATNNVKRRVTRTTEGRTPQGRKTETTESWDWYETQMNLLNKE